MQSAPPLSTLHNRQNILNLLGRRRKILVSLLGNQDIIYRTQELALDRSLRFLPETSLANGESHLRSSHRPHSNTYPKPPYRCTLHAPHP